MLHTGWKEIVENFIEIQGHQLVQLRNPWGEGEWTGDWSDEWINANRKAANVKPGNINRKCTGETCEGKICSRRGLTAFTSAEENALDVDDDPENDDDGRFWMAWNDFVDEFENLAVCHLPEADEYEKRVRGTFRYFMSKIYSCFFNGNI